MANDKPTDPTAAAGFSGASRSLLTDLGEVLRPTRAGGAAPAGFDAADYAAADLLEVHFADGSVYYTNPDDFAQQHGGSTTRSANAGDKVQLPFMLTLGAAASATRAGPEGVPVERYRIAKLTPPTELDRLYQWGAVFTDAWNTVFGADAPPGTNRAAAALCHAYESSQLDPSVGEAPGALLQWTGNGWTAADAARLPADLRDVVLLLHGTASSTAGSFGGLWKAPAGGVAADWQALAGQHGRLVLGYEHRSLTQGPLDNAFELLQSLGRLGLPAGTTLHMVSHSRGGLLADLVTLALGSATEVQARAQRLAPLFLDLFPAEHGQHKSAQRLFALLGAATFKLDWQAGTCVRVASPSRGTLLADRRTDFFLSMLLRSVGLAFGGNGNPWYERLQGLVRGLVAARADAAHIPGLEAMIPGAPLSLALNTALEPAVTLPGRLRVIAGDSQGYGPLGLASLLGDVFYGLHDHDFVVHTHAMFGGLPRTDARSRRVADRSVTHFGYFEPGSLTRNTILGALDGNDTGFVPLADDEARTRGLWQMLDPDPLARRSRAQWLADISAANAVRKPIVVVLPGIMGSELARAQDSASDPVWLALASIINGRLADLNLASPRALQPSGMMALAYERLLERLRPRFHVVTFPFDWRQPIPKSAEDLIALLKVLLPEAQRLEQPVHLLAHSMGGLVARLALWCDDFGLAEKRGDTTKQLEARGLRLVQCGTPNRGSYAPLQLLMQQHPLTRTIARMARGVTPRDLAKFGAAYPGLMGMMPADADPLAGDLFTQAAWDKVVEADKPQAGTPDAIVTPDPTVRAAAAAVRDWLVSSFAALKANPNVFYIAGQGLTPLNLKVLGGSPGRPGRLVLGVSSQGDGTVPWNSTLDPVRTWYTDCEHGSLLDHRDAFGAIIDLLQQGRTTQLRQQRPTPRSSDAALEGLAFSLPALPSLPPDPVAHVLGLDRQAERRGQVAPVSVRIVHGSLDYARHPLLVGHNSDDGVHGAVHRVDAKLGGQLRQAITFGLFTGAAGTAVYLRGVGEGAHPPAYPGAVVVGLGPLGTLTPAGLADTVTRGVMDHAFALMHQTSWTRGGGALRLDLSAVLVGSGPLSLTLRSALTGLLQGVWRAAQMLAQPRPGERPVQLGELEIIELHEGVALDAAYALAALLTRPEWQERLRWPQGVIEQREGGLRGYRPSNEATRWQRLIVAGEPRGAMRFELVAEGARVESVHNRADLDELLGFISQTCDAGATRRTSAAEQDEFSRGLYNQLLPQTLRSRIADFQQTVLLLDDRTAQLPWELLAPPQQLTAGEQAAQPLAVQAGMLRQRLTADFRPADRGRLRRPGRSTRALVVGAPDTSGWVDAQGQALRFAELPGAAAEARVVETMLKKSQWDVESLIRGDAGADGGAAQPALPNGVSAADLRWQLMRPGPWRVLHLAGHGMVDLWQRDVQHEGVRVPVHATGMVLSGQRMLTADLVALMDPPPEFVFINCCYSGRDGARTTPDGLQGRPAIAASLALAFIKMGSRAVVAAGWQVDDQDGRQFAEVLYDRLLNGDNFGDAVLAARSALWRGGAPRSNTWGAYQCYGDPEWRLVSPEATADGDSIGNPLAGAEACRSTPELAERILQLVHLAGDGRTPVLQKALDDLLALLAADALRCNWLHDALVLAALARAWRELGATDRSLQVTAQALAQAHAQLSIDQLEHAANLLSRRPGDQAKACAAAWQALDQLDAATAGLQLSIASAGHAADGSDLARAERNCLRGSALARQAGADLPPSARAELQLKAASWYAAAHTSRLQLGADAGALSYALANAVTLANLASIWADVGDNSGLRRAVLAGGWWDAPIAPDAPTPTARRASPALPGKLRAAIDHALTLLEADAGLDFWAQSGTLNLRMGRMLLGLQVGTEDGLRQADSDGMVLLDALERLLLRWPSPGQLDSLGKRPGEVLQALQALAQRPAAGRSKANALKLGIQVLQQVIDRIARARATLDG